MASTLKLRTRILVTVLLLGTVLLVGAVALSPFSAFRGRGQVTHANFDKIHERMSSAEVDALLGRENCVGTMAVVVSGGISRTSHPHSAKVEYYRGRAEPWDLSQRTVAVHYRDDEVIRKDLTATSCTLWDVMQDWSRRVRLRLGL